MSSWERGRPEILGMIQRRELTTVTANAELQAQGLRATTAGGHLAIQHAVQAQFGASMGAILRPVDRIRATRHEAEYPSQSTYIDEDTVLDDLPAAVAVVESVAKALPHLSPFIP